MYYYFEGPRRGVSGLTDLNKRITDLKMGNTTTPEIRRDSNSTVSTYYGSMKSSDLESSRRSSQVRNDFVLISSTQNPFRENTF